MRACPSGHFKRFNRDYYALTFGIETYECVPEPASGFQADDTPCGNSRYQLRKDDYYYQTTGMNRWYCEESAWIYDSTY